jgi:hypothetical protein
MARQLVQVGGDVGAVAAAFILQLDTFELLKTLSSNSDVREMIRHKDELINHRMDYPATSARPSFTGRSKIVRGTVAGSNSNPSR